MNVADCPYCSGPYVSSEFESDKLINGKLTITMICHCGSCYKDWQERYFFDGNVRNVDTGKIKKKHPAF